MTDNKTKSTFWSVYSDDYQRQLNKIEITQKKSQPLPKPRPVPPSIQQSGHSHYNPYGTPRYLPKINITPDGSPNHSPRKSPNHLQPPPSISDLNQDDEKYGQQVRTPDGINMLQTEEDHEERREIHEIDPYENESFMPQAIKKTMVKAHHHNQG